MMAVRGQPLGLSCPRGAPSDVMAGRLFSGAISCIIREEAVATCVAQTRKSLWYDLPFLPSGKNEMVKLAFFTIGEK